MTYSSRNSLTNTNHPQICAKAKTTAVVVVFLLLLAPRLWADSRKEYIHADGRVVAVETSVAGCGSYSFYEIPEGGNFGTAGGSGNVIVHGGDGVGCVWTTASNVPWVTVTSGGSGNGNGNVTYDVAANSGPARSGTITVAGQNFTVNQANGCTYNISPTSANPAAGGGVYGGVSVTSYNANCTPPATSNAVWITNVTVIGSGTTRTVGYTVAANSGVARTGTITIGGNVFTITQAGGITCQQVCANAMAQCVAAAPPPSPTCAASCVSVMGPACSSNPSCGSVGVVQYCTSICANQAAAQCAPAYSSCLASCQ